MDGNIAKEDCINVQLKNESPILFENNIQIKKENDTINKEDINNSEKVKDIRITSSKKDLEQLERRKLLEEYKRKKQEKKNSAQKGISSKNNVNTPNSVIKHEPTSSNSKKSSNVIIKNNNLKLYSSNEIKKEINGNDNIGIIKDPIKKESNVRKVKSTSILKSIKKELDVIDKNLNSADSVEKPKFEVKNNEKNNLNVNQTGKEGIKNYKIKRKLHSTNDTFNESKSFISVRKSKIKDEDIPANTTIILPTNLTNKNKKFTNVLSPLSTKKSSKSIYQPFLKPSGSDIVHKPIKVHKSLVQNIPATSNAKIKIETKKLSNNILRSKSDLSSYSPSIPKSEIKILKSPLISSPTSSPNSIKTIPNLHTLNQLSKSSLVKKKQLKTTTNINLASPPSSKKLNNSIHTPSRSVSSSLRANQSFSVANISNKRSRFNINESFVDHEKRPIKKLRSNNNTNNDNTHNKNNIVLDTKLLSNIKESDNKLISNESNSVIKNKISKTTNDKIDIVKNDQKIVNSAETINKKKSNSSCPHYLMPTANWKTKVVVKPTIEKKSSLKLSPISKTKNVLKLANLSKTIKKNNNNNNNIINYPTIITSTLTNTSNIAATSNMTSNSNIETSILSSKSNNQSVYTPKSSKSNSIDNNLTKFSTPTINRSKTVTNYSIKSTSKNINKDTKKERVNNGIISRSATISTPSKRINKNIKRNNIAFTEENEQDINRMFISAETLKSTSIDSFFSHYNSTEINKKDNHSDKVFDKKCLNNISKLEKKNNSRLNSINEDIKKKVNSLGDNSLNKNEKQKIEYILTSENHRNIEKDNIIENKNFDTNELKNSEKTCHSKDKQLLIINQENVVKDIPKENLISQFNKNEKLDGKNIEIKRKLKEKNPNHVIEGTLTIANMSESIVNESEENLSFFDKPIITPENPFKNNTKSKKSDIKNNSMIINQENKKADLIDIDILENERKKKKENVISNSNYQIDTFLEAKDSEIVNKNNDTTTTSTTTKYSNLKDELKQNKFSTNNTNLLNFMTLKEIEEEMSSIDENDIHDIKDLSFKIKNIENLVAGTSVKVNKIIEDFQDDSYIIDDSKAHRLNASFTISNLSNMNKCTEEIITNQHERPYHSFIINTNNNSFILRLASTSQFIEEIKSDRINTDDQTTYDPSEPLLSNISHLNDHKENNQELIEHCSFVLSQKKQTNHSQEQESKISGINTPKKSNHHSSLTSTHSPKHSSKKRKKTKKTIYKNEIIKKPLIDNHYRDFPFSNHLPIVGGDVNGKGSSIMILTPIRAKKKDREEFGVTSVVTPVRRSLRNIQKKMTGSSSHKKSKNQQFIINIKEDPDTPIPIKYHSDELEEGKKNHERLYGPEIIKENLKNKEENNKGKIKKEEQKILRNESFTKNDYEELFKTSNKFEAIEDILEKHDYAFVPNKAIIIENFDFPEEINYTPKKEIKIEEEE